LLRHCRPPKPKRLILGDHGHPLKPMNRACGPVILILLALALGSCDYQEDLSSIIWPTYPVGGEIREVESSPGPFPSPTSQFLYPGAPVPFQGADSLDCGEPQGGDNHFGYCLRRGRPEVYVWGDCAGECLDGPYPGTEILIVSYADSEIFRDVIDLRDTNRRANCCPERLWLRPAYGEALT
jgi:hypothetical protein